MLVCKQIPRKNVQLVNRHSENAACISVEFTSGSLGEIENAVETLTCRLVFSWHFSTPVAITQ